MLDETADRAARRRGPGRLRAANAGRRRPEVVLSAPAARCRVPGRRPRLLAEAGIRRPGGVAARRGSSSPQQDEDYRDEVLPPGVPGLAVEAASTFGWERYADASVSIDHFGASAPGEVSGEFGFKPDNVAARATALLTAPTRPVTTRQHRVDRGPPRPTAPDPRGPPMTTLHDLYDQQGQSPWLDNLRRDWLQDGTLAGPGRPGHPGGHLQPDHLRQGHQRPGHLRRAVRARSSHHVGRGRLLGPGGRRHRSTPWPSCAPSTTAPAGPTASSRWRWPRRWPTTPRDHRAARALHERIDQPNLLVKIPATPECVPVHPPDDQRGPQHQRHADLQPRPLRRGHRGLPVRPRGARRLRGRRPVRAWPAWPRSSSAGSTPRSTGGSRRRRPAAADAGTPRPAGQGGRGPGPAGLPAVHPSASPGPAGRPWRPRGPRCSGRCGRPPPPRTRLSRPCLRGHPDRPGHGQHHARRDRRRLPRPRHRGPDRRHRRRRGPVRSSTGWPRPASTWRTWPACSRPRAWPRSPPRFDELMSPSPTRPAALTAG